MDRESKPVDKRIRRGLSYIVLALFAGLAGCGKTETVRAKVTVAVEADGKRYAGSAVDEVSVTDLPFWQKQLAPGTSYGFDQRGEAVAVEIPGRGILFVGIGAELNRMGSEPIAVALFDAAGGPNLVDLRTFTEARLKFKDMPIMGCFRDLSKPGTFQSLSPDNLAPCFGSNVKLVSFEIAATKDNLTNGLFRHLPWLEGKSGSERLTDFVSVRDFVDRNGR